jgi:hypothetical protein
MDKWQKEFSEMLETVTEHVEDFFVEFAHEATEVVNAFVAISEEVSTQLNTILTDEVEQFVAELVSLS